MGYIEGLLGGFTTRKREVEQERLREAELSNAREAKIFETLLNSPDPETRDLAAAGLLQSAGPRRKKGGLRGFLGEIESGPYLEQIRKLSPEVADQAGPAPTTGASMPGGMVSAPPSTSLAQSPTSATQVGAPPLRAIESAPPELQTRNDAVDATTAQPTAPLPSLPVQPGLPTPSAPAPAGPAGAALTGQPASPRMRPREVFQTEEQRTLGRYSAQERGEILGVVAAYEAVGVPHDQAVQRAIDERMRSRGVGATGLQSIAGELPDGTPAFGVFDRQRGVYINPDTGQPLDGFRPRTTTGSTSLGGDRESLARELFGKPAAQLTPAQMTQVNQRVTSFAGVKAGAVTTGRGEAAAGIPLSTPQRFQATTDLATQWTKATANRQEMQRQHSLMQTGLTRYDADPIGGSQAVLVTFQKVLDPTSVVRESEYARSPQGLAILDRLEGVYERYKSGGAGVPKPVLAEMVETARQFLTDENMRSGLDNVRARIYKTATDYEIDPANVFPPGDLPRTPGATPRVGAPPPTGPAGPTAPTVAAPPAGGGLDALERSGRLFVDANGNLIRR